MVEPLIDAKAASPDVRPGGVLVELCVASVDDAVVAASGGADRIELNAALALGGLTPSAGLVAEVRAAVQVPLVVMVRPRPGGFCYSDSDFAVLLRDAASALEQGADGIAFGVLTSDGRVDVARCRAVVGRAGSTGAQGAVFHRAFDFTPDPFEALDQLIDAGIRRVMTSGQQPTADQGAALIAALIGQAAGRIEVLPAGGIRPWNVAGLVARTGCNQVHAALREPQADSSLNHRPAIRLAAGAAEGAAQGCDVTSPTLLAELRRVLARPS